MFGLNGEQGEPQGEAQAQQKPNLPLKTFKVTRSNFDTGELDIFEVKAHFLSNLDGGGVAFNIYDFETPPQGVTTVRVLSDFHDIEQLLPSGLVSAAEGIDFGG